MPKPPGTRRITNLLGQLALAATLLSARAEAQHVTIVAPKAVAAPKPFARLSASAHALRDSIVALTEKQLGVRYRRGASSPESGFDCSGLVRYVMAHFGAELPRTSTEQAFVGKRIERDIGSLKPGDLLTFGRGSRISHIGIYIGHGLFVHAPRPGARVREEALDNVRDSWWKGARRIFAFDDAAADSVLN